MACFVFILLVYIYLVPSSSKTEPCTWQASTLSQSNTLGLLCGKVFDTFETLSVECSEGVFRKTNGRR